MSSDRPATSSAGAFQLRILSGPANTGLCYLLSRGQMKIGRFKDCEIHLLVNGDRVRGNRPLMPGDLIQLPEFILKFEAAN